MGLRCASLTDAVVERQARKKGEERVYFTELGGCLALRSYARYLHVDRLDAVRILRIGFGGGLADGQECKPGCIKE